MIPQTKLVLMKISKKNVHVNYIMNGLTMFVIIIVMLGFGLLILYTQGYLDYFFIQEGDECTPEGTPETNATYTINADKECVFTCNSGYVKRSGVCVLDETGESCDVTDPDSRGSYTYDSTGTCVLSSCDDRYSKEGGECVKTLPMAQYIRIEGPPNVDALTINEIEVFDHDNVNVANGKTTTGGPDGVDGFSFNQLVDEDEETLAQTGSTGDHFMEIDLGITTKITKIVIIHKDEGSSLNGAIIRLLDDDKKDIFVTPFINTTETRMSFNFNTETSAWSYTSA